MTTDRKAIAQRFLERASAGHARDEAARLLADDFRHHNVYFAGDAASLLAAMDENAHKFPDKRLTVVQAIGDGDNVATFCRVRHSADGPDYAVMHMFRFDGDRIAELWDVAQEVPSESPNQYGAF